MAYEVEQDRLRAMLPEGYESLRPVLRINAEVRGGNQCHVELNTAVRHDGKRGWLNIAHWQSPDDDIHFKHNGATTCFVAPFLRIAFTHTGIAGGCPAEHDNVAQSERRESSLSMPSRSNVTEGNDGCFFLTPEGERLRPTETIASNKEFCDCDFRWLFTSSDASGRSIGKTLPAIPTPRQNTYPLQALTAENAAAIPCKQVLGSYVVEFERENVE